ncbi:hypothetical protein BC827DRAFT_1386764 [Russula dissimulans]|nr:hypothetical protein BC827DRAFT_1386764 [Russula dissimulans]
MTPPVGDPAPDLPFFHYMTERERINRYSAIKRTTVLASLPERCPYRARSSPKNSKKLELGWLEFHSPEPPDPQVARPGDVWIQIPLAFDPTASTPNPSVCRLFVCYSTEGRQWTEWEGDERVHTNDPPVGIHPLASPAMWDGTTKRDAQFYLAFTGSEFTWVNGTRLAVIAGQWRLGRVPGDWMKRLIAKHSIDGIPFLPPAEAIAAWAERKTLTASGVQIKKDKKRVSNEPTPELPSTKRRKPENETSSLEVVHDWHTVAAPSSFEAGTISYPYSFVSWPHVSHWTVMQPSAHRPSTPPSSHASDDPMDPPPTPPSPTFVLRPATFTLPVSPANESQPSDDPPPTPPSPVPQLQRPPNEGRPPPAMYPHVSFTPTLSPPRYGERARKRVLRSSSALPIPTQSPPASSAGPSASATVSPSASAPSTVDTSTSAVSTSVSAPPATTEGRRAPAGAIDAPPRVRGKYAKAGATQRGWSLYVGDEELLMPFPCDKCKRAGAICSGLDGERCGRCRAIRKPCSHNMQPRPLMSKSLPSGTNIILPLSISTVDKGPVTSSAKGDEEVPSRRRGGGPIGNNKVRLRLKLGHVPGKPAACADRPPKSSSAQNDPLAESPDEDDNAVEELMHSDRDEENTSMGTVSGNAHAGSMVPAMGSSGEPNAQAVDEPHADTSFLSVGEVADAHLSTGVPTIAVKTLDGKGASIEPCIQSVENLEDSGALLNNCATGFSEVFCHVGPVERCNPASHPINHDVPESQITDNSGNNVVGPVADPAGDPAPDCSQEVCIRAADGAAAGGGSSSPTTGRGVSPRVDLLVGRPQTDTALLPLLPPRQAIDDGPPPGVQTSVGEDDDIVRYMEITLSGMAQVQDGLRGVLAIQKRRRVQKRKIAARDK